MTQALRTFQDRHVLGALFATSVKNERNDSRHGNALGTDFDRRFDIILQDVQMNVTTAVLDARVLILYIISH